MEKTLKVQKLSSVRAAKTTKAQRNQRTRRALSAARAAMDLDMAPGGGAPVRRGGSGQLAVSNLDPRVTNQDIKELFGELGPLLKHSLNFDARGRSKGTAEVVFRRAQDAQAAVRKYNGVKLDGKPMRIEEIGGGPTTLPSGGQRLSSGITVSKPRAGAGARAGRGAVVGGGRARTVTVSTKGRGNNRGGMGGANRGNRNAMQT